MKWQPIATAVMALARMCDGAVVLDGHGFDAADAAFGHRLAAQPLSRWTMGNLAAAHAMLRKYRRQLQMAGIEYDALPVPPPCPASKCLRGEHALDWVDGLFVLRVPYDERLVEQIGLIPGRRWRPERRSWTFPISSGPDLRALIGRTTVDTGWEVTSVARAALRGEPPRARETDSRAVRGTVDVENGEFMLHVRGYDAVLVSELRAIPTRRWDPERRVNVIGERDGAQLQRLLDRWGDFEVSLEARSQLRGLGIRDAESKALSERLRLLSCADDAPLVVEGLGGELRPFQRAGVAYVLAADGRALIGDDMGTGKTVQSLACVQARGAFPAVVVCPASVKLAWRDHVMGPMRWRPDHPIPRDGWLPGRRAVVLTGRRPDPVALAGADVIILNWEVLADWLEVLKSARPRAVIYDESHYAKSAGSGRAKAALTLTTSMPRDALLLATTGTAVMNRPVELVSQLRLLRRLGDFGGSGAFRNRYCDRFWDGFRWNDSGASNLEELNLLLRETCFVRRTKQQVMRDLPPKRIARVPVALTNRRVYARAEAETIRFLMDAVLLDEEFTARIAGLPAAEREELIRERRDDRAERARRAEKIVRMNLLRRVAGEGKLRAACWWIQEFLESTDAKLVVFAHHVPVQRALLRQFPDAARVLGESSAQDRQRSIDEFQGNPECRLIVCSLKAAGVGITLTAASDVLTIELDWTPATHDQAEDRAHRMGQPGSVTCWYLLADGTIDEDMDELIEQKRQITSATLDGEARRRAKSESIMGALEERLLSRGAQ